MEEPVYYVGLDIRIIHTIFAFANPAGRKVQIENKVT